MNPSPLSLFEENNQHLVSGVRTRLASFCADPPLHARFLNMLSLLEHIGSRKIVTCPAMRDAGMEQLKHLAEETRHALFFKRAADRMALHPLDYATRDTIACASAHFYMGRLDVEISRELNGGAPILAYLYMSLIVELRAVWLYRIYQDVLMEQAVGLTLKSVLTEEEMHLHDMVAHLLGIDPKTEIRMALFSQFEENRFRSLWSQIEQECAEPGLAAE